MSDRVRKSARGPGDGDPPGQPDGEPRGFSRRRLLGGALAGTLAAVLLGGEHGRGRRAPDRWAGKTRWIGHC